MSSAENIQAVAETTSVLAQSSAKTAFFASGGAMAGKWLGLDPVTAIGLVVGIGGLIVSLCSFFINWHYKKLDEKRKDREEQREIEQLRIRNEIFQREQRQKALKDKADVKD